MWPLWTKERRSQRWERGAPDLCTDLSPPLPSLSHPSCSSDGYWGELGKERSRERFRVRRGSCWLGWDRVRWTSTDCELGKAPLGSPQTLLSAVFLHVLSIQALHILLISDSSTPNSFFGGAGGRFYGVGHRLGEARLSIVRIG